MNNLPDNHNDLLPPEEEAACSRCEEPTHPLGLDLQGHCSDCALLEIQAGYDLGGEPYDPEKHGRPTA